MTSSAHRHSGNTGQEETELNFTTKMLSEVSNIVWRLKDFKSLTEIKDSLKRLTLNFEAGVKIGVPSKWRFVITRIEDDLSINLELAESPRYGQRQIFAKVEVVLKHEDGTVYKRHCIGDVARDMKAVESLGWKSIDSVETLISPETKLLVNGCLIFYFRFEMFAHNTMSTKNALTEDIIKLRALSRSAITDDLHQVLINKLSPDVMIKTKDSKIFQAHRIILAARSPVFLAMFESKMLESSTQCIRIDDIGSEAMKIVLEYIYSGSLDDDWIPAANEVIYAAEKYNLLLLKKLCDQTFIKACTNETAYDCLKLAKLYGLDIAITDIEEYITINIASILTVCP